MFVIKWMISARGLKSKHLRALMLALRSQDYGASGITFNFLIHYFNSRSSSRIHMSYNNFIQFSLRHQIKQSPFSDLADSIKNFLLEQRCLSTFLLRICV